jgi:hypothetical protein
MRRCVLRRHYETLPGASVPRREPPNRRLRKGPDTVGELESAEICVSHMPSLKAKKLGKLTQEKVLLEL